MGVLVKVRSALLVLALLPALGGGVAQAAAAKKVCNIVQDETGDAVLVAVPGNDSDDIVSADLASDGKTLTAVVRTAGYTNPDPEAPLGRHYLVELDAKGADTTLFLSARTYPQGTKFFYGYSGVNVVVNTSYTQGEAQGFVDAAKHEVHISVPVSVFKDHGAKFLKGTKVTPTKVTVYRMLGQGVVPSQQVGPVWAPLGGLSEGFDEASGKSYVVGTKSCVTPGK